MYLSRIMTIIMLTLSLALSLQTRSHAIDAATQDLAFDSLNNKFYHASNGTGWYAFDTNSGAEPDRYSFWKMAEQMEMVEDAYERTNNNTYKGMIHEMFNGLNSLSGGGPDWGSWNTFYDDIMWAVIACVRAYWDTGDRNYLTTAEWQFNKAWTGATTGIASNGSQGLWQTKTHDWKDSAVCGPAIIAAVYLSWADPNTGYKADAENVSHYYFNTLVYSSGEVAQGQKSNGTIVPGPLSYNEGTCIGAALAMFNAGEGSNYLNYAYNAAYWTRNSYAGTNGAPAGILPGEYDSKGGAGDNPGFKGIFGRWASLWARQLGYTDYMSFLQNNANVAWAHRNGNGVTWSIWYQNDPNSYMTSWECSSAVAMEQDVDADAPPSGWMNIPIALWSGAASHYVSTNLNWGDNLQAGFANTIGSWEKFELVPVDPHHGFVALKSMQTGYYVSVDLNDSNRLKAAWATSPSTWEKFEFSFVGSGKVALKSCVTGYWVSCDLNSSDVLRAAWAKTPSTWETFNGFSAP